MAPGFLSSQPRPASRSGSYNSNNNIQAVEDAMQRSSLSRSLFSTSSTATTLASSPDTPLSHSTERSVSSTLSTSFRRISVDPGPPMVSGDPLSTATHLSSSGSSVTLKSSSSTRERLRLAEEENDSLRRAVEEQRNIVDRLKCEGGSSGFCPSDAQDQISQLKRDIHAAGAELPQRSTAGLFKAICSTDLLFLIDTTGSMANQINAAKEQVKSIVKDIGAAFLNEAEVRMAVVGYKDHTDVPNIQFLDFTTSADTVRSFLSGLRADGGGDAPEDVLGGIRRALHATWTHRTRCIIHIADAPPHGRSLHDLSDPEDTFPHPGSEPHGLTHSPLLQQMIKLNINYALLRINHTTDRMAFTFFKEYVAASAGCTLHRTNTYIREARSIPTGSDNGRRIRGNSKSRSKSGLLFEELELGTSYSTLRHLVLKNVTNSVSRTAVRTVTSGGRTSKGGSEKKIDTNLINIDEEEDAMDERREDAIDEEDDVNEATLETTAPQWNLRGWLDETLKVEGFSPDVMVHGASTLNDMMAHNDNIKMNIVKLIIYKRSLPFSQGAMRVASYARTTACTDKFVVKSYKRDGKRIAHLAEDMQCQALCKAFALEFNALLGGKHSIDFIVTTCLTGRTNPGTGDECMSLEPYIKGNYIKYNSNSSFVNAEIPNNPFNQAAQAFSHFTYERSQGKFLVCDLQGVGGVLTDPAIHTLDPERFKLADTNLGKDGFKLFFATHVCNSICRKLALKSDASMVVSGKHEFRERWPAMENRVCCSNKLCGKIVGRASSRKSDEFPGHHWCHSCWPQLHSSVVKLMCVAPGPDHEFEMSKFFYRSQGRSTPRLCHEHREDDGTVLRPGFSRNEAPGMEVTHSEDHRAVAVGGNLWARLKSVRRRRSKATIS